MENNKKKIQYIVHLILKPQNESVREHQIFTLNHQKIFADEI
jgi:hypothetical protein